MNASDVGKFWFDGAPDEGAEIFQSRHSEPRDFIKIVVIQLIAHQVEMRTQEAQVTHHAAFLVWRPSERNFAVVRVPVNTTRAFGFNLSLERMSCVKEETLADFVIHI